MTDLGLVHGVRKIAVLRANNLGDLVFSLPALEALRAAYPAAEVVLLATEWQREFLRGRPSPVDRVEVLPVWPGVRERPGRGDDAAERERFVDGMRAEAFDIALQLHGGGRSSNPLVLALGARVTAGSRSLDAAPLDRWIPFAYWQHEVLRYLELVALVGARPVRVVPSVVVTAADVDAAGAVVTDDGRPIVVIHPGATDPRRRWSSGSFAEVGRALALGRGARVVVTGVEADRDLTHRVASAVPGATDTAGRLSLRGLTGLLARAALVVSNDTGPFHLAGAVGVPAVGVFWIGNAVNGGPVTTRWTRALLSFRTACPTCGTDCIREACEHDASFVADVRVRDVLAAAEELLDLRAAVPRSARGPAAA